jgi:hypothetical protein
MTLGKAIGGSLIAIGAVVLAFLDPILVDSTFRDWRYIRILSVEA